MISKLSETETPESSPYSEVMADTLKCPLHLHTLFLENCET